MIGDHVVTYTPLGGAAVDLSCLIETVSIHHGRDDADSQPEPAAATLNLSTYTGEDAPPEYEIGAAIRITTTVSGTSSTRFVGTITDVEHEWDDAGGGTPNLVGSQLIAVAPLADLGRRVIGAEPFPQELDGARVSRIMTAAGVTLDPAYSDPGTVQILPRDVDSQPALDIARSTATDAMGLVWHTRSGEVRYADANHRRGVVAALQLDACDLLLSPTWKRTTEGLLNLVSIGYGPTPDEGEQPRYIADRPDSVGRYGRYELSTATELAEYADAEALGQLLLTRNSSPVWVMSELPVDVKGLDAADTTALLGLDLGALLDLTGLPAAGGAPTSAALWVEGWSESLAWGDHELTLVVTGYCRTVPAPWWNDVNPEQTWDSYVEHPPTLLGTNGFINPGCEVGAAGLYANNAALGVPTRDTGAPIAGAASWLTARIGTLDPTVSSVYTTTLPVNEGQRMTFGLDARTEVAGRRLRAYILWRTGTGAANGSTSQSATLTPMPDPGTARGVFSAVAPPGTGQAIGIFIVETLAGPCLAGERVYWDRLSGVVGDAYASGDYFDGDTPPTPDYTYRWVGTPHASSSEQWSAPDPADDQWVNLTWDDAACLGPPVNRGRWDDTPASSRWDLMPAATTWDTWK